MYWIIGALLLAALIVGVIFLRKKQRKAADERLARKRENYLAKRRAVVAVRGSMRKVLARQLRRHRSSGHR